MPVGYADLKLYASASNPDPTSATATGGIPGTQAYGASPGELLPAYSAPATGTIDTNAIMQWQKAFCSNRSAASSLLVARIFLKNGLVRPSSGTGYVFVNINSAGDIGKQVNVVEAVSGACYYETIATPTATGTANMTQGGNGGTAFCIQAQLVDAYGNQTPAAGPVDIYWGANLGAAIYLGTIPGPSQNGNTWAWAYEGINLLGIATTYNFVTVTGENSTNTNGHTAPAGTFTKAVSYATGIAVRLAPGTNDTLVPGDAQGFWIQQTLQPGQPASDNSQLCWTLGGQTGA